MDLLDSLYKNTKSPRKSRYLLQVRAIFSTKWTRELQRGYLGHGRAFARYRADFPRIVGPSHRGSKRSRRRVRFPEDHRDEQKTYRGALHDLIGDVVDIESLIATASKYYYAKVDAGVPLKPGARACIEWLSQTGIPQTVATSSKQTLARSKLAQHDLVDRFHSIASGDQVSQGKPHPEIFETAANRMNIPPNECLVFEDSRHGVIGAHAAGARVILVPDLAEHGPDTESLAFEIWESLEQGPKRFADWRSG